MEDIKKNEAETVKNEAPKPGTKAYVEAELAAAKAELEALKAKQEALDKASEPAVRKLDWEPKGTGKMVKIRIPRTKADQENVFVSVNLRTYMIERGKDVEVPDFVAEVLCNQEKMLEEIMLFEAANQRK